jgi:hypothetical protein
MSTPKRICFKRQTNQFFSEFYKRFLFFSERTVLVRTGCFDCLVMALNDQQPVIPINYDGKNDNDNDGVPMLRLFRVPMEASINKVEQTKLLEFWGQR